MSGRFERFATTPAWFPVVPPPAFVDTPRGWFESPCARVPTAVQSVLEQAAAYLGVPLNSFVVTAAVEKANALLATERTIQLGRKDAELFAKMLENPPAPSPALLEAGGAYRKMIRE